MQTHEQLYSFVKEHINSDLSRLLLSAARFPEIDVPFAVEQIAARRRIREKLPTWYANEKLLFSSKLAAEQASSEQAAHYKLRILGDVKRLCDLTGGLGVDSYFFSQKAKEVIYVERSEACFRVAMHNFSELQRDHIRGFCGDASHILNELEEVDVFYLDPVRRGTENARVYALSDCKPDVTELLPRLFEKAPCVLVKLSPMVDIRHTLSLLEETTEIHVVSVKNECKELLFVLDRDPARQDLSIHCVNYTSDGTEQLFSFTLQEEEACPVELSDSIQMYLYEPNASVMKAGAYKTITARFPMKKLHVNSHLYTSDQLMSSFPGRIFQVREVLPFSNKNAKSLVKQFPKAHVSIRNFPVSADELRKRLQLSDGGDVYIFGTTVASDQKVLICCEKALV